MLDKLNITDIVFYAFAADKYHMFYYSLDKLEVQLSDYYDKVPIVEEEISRMKEQLKQL